jgi:hypothetical protein
VETFLIRATGSGFFIALLSIIAINDLNLDLFAIVHWLGLEAGKRQDLPFLPLKLAKDKTCPFCL